MILTEFDQKGYEEFIREEAREEGREEHAHKSIFLLLSRFGELPEYVKEAVNGISDEKLLDSLLLAAAEAKSNAEFAKELAKYN